MNFKINRKYKRINKVMQKKFNYIVNRRYVLYAYK